MAKRVDLFWINEHRDKFVQANFQGNIHFVNCTYAPAIANLCLVLADRNIPYKVLNLGGGVKKITNDMTVCPKCGGCGKC